MRDMYKDQDVIKVDIVDIVEVNEATAAAEVMMQEIVFHHIKNTCVHEILGAEEPGSQIQIQPEEDISAKTKIICTIVDHHLTVDRVTKDRWTCFYEEQEKFVDIIGDENIINFKRKKSCNKQRNKSKTYTFETEKFKIQYYCHFHYIIKPRGRRADFPKKKG